MQFVYSVELNVCSWHDLAFGEARSGQLIHKEVLLERAAAPSFMSAAQALAATAVAAPLDSGAALLATRPLMMMPDADSVCSTALLLPPC